MRKYIAVLMMMFVSVSGEDVIHYTFYNDGSANLSPDSAMFKLYIDGAVVDSCLYDSASHFQAGGGIICTLSSSNTGIHWIEEHFAEGSDVGTFFVREWDNRPDTAQANVATAEGADSLKDSLYAVLDTLQDGDNGILADVNAISTDQTAADSLERMLNGERATLYLSQLNVQPPDGDKHAITAIGSGAGDGIYASGGPTGDGGTFVGLTGGHGIRAQGGASSGDGIYAAGGATGGHGINANAGGGSAIYLEDESQDLTAEIADAVWDEDSTGHYTSPNLAYTLAQAVTDRATVTDAVWGFDYDSSSFDAGTMGDSASGWGATAATGLTVAGIIDSMEQHGFITYTRGADSVLRLAGLIIVDTLNSDSLPAFYVTGDDGTVWFRSRGNNTALSLTNTDSTDRAALYIWGNYGNGVQIGSQGPSTEHTITVYNNGEGDAVRLACGNNNDTGTVLNIVHAGTDSTKTTLALQIEGMTYIHGRDDRSEDAIRAHAYKAGRVIYFWSDSTPSRWSTTAGDSVALIFAGGIRTDIEGTIDKATQVDTVLSTITASASLTGTGPYELTVFAVDTSGADDTLSGVLLSVYDATGSRLGYATTESNGKKVFGLDSGSYTIKSSTMGGYYWNNVVCTLAAANDTIAIKGFNIAIGAPTGDSLCRVYGYAYRPDGNALKGATVTWQITGRNIWDVCNGVSINKANGTTTSDSTGLWTVDLLYSTCLQRTASGTDSIAYRFNIDYPSGLPVVNRTFYVPAADSAEFSW